jgi:hypothetical protein
LIIDQIFINTMPVKGGVYAQHDAGKGGSICSSVFKLRFWCLRLNIQGL